jgi:hypothetical protein
MVGYVGTKKGATFPMVGSMYLVKSSFAQDIAPKKSISSIKAPMFLIILFIIKLIFVVIKTKKAFLY